MLRATEVHVTPEVQAKLDQLVSTTGQTPDAIINEVLSNHFDGLLETRATLNNRYDDIVSGRVQSIDGPTMVRDMRARLEAQRENS